MIAAARSSAPTCLAPRELSRRPKARAPQGACDTHFHVFSRRDTPLVSPRAYTPEDATFQDYSRAIEKLGVARGVLVQPSVYGQDNGLMLKVLAEHPQTLRGIVVLAPAIGDDELYALHANGARGARINLCNPGTNTLDDVQSIGVKVADLGWHVQLHVDLNLDLAIDTLVQQSPTPIVIDHFGLLSSRAQQASIAALERALRTGRCWVKLSAPYRCGDKAMPFAASASLATSLINNHGDRLLWGSDWPHPGLFEAMPDDTDLFDAFLDWCGSAERARQILVDNPARLYWM